MANCVSIFNMVMCTQNEFDPIKIEAILQKRRDFKEEEKKHKEEDKELSKALK